MGKSLTVYRFLECRPDSYQDWYQQGNALLEKQHLQDALLSYDKALEYHPSDYWAWYKRGITLEELGCNEEAIGSYAIASSVSPKNYWAWYSQACNQSKFMVFSGQ